MDIINLHNKIAAVCPILGVSIGDPEDKDTWRIDYAVNATQNQITAAQAAVTAFDPDAPPVPDMVTNYQARVALINAGLFTAVNTALLALDPANDARQAWEYANNFFRNSAFIATLGPTFGLTEDQIDALFVAANAVV